MYHPRRRESSSSLKISEFFSGCILKWDCVLWVQYFCNHTSYVMILPMLLHWQLNVTNCRGNKLNSYPDGLGGSFSITKYKDIWNLDAQRKKMHMSYIAQLLPWGGSAKWTKDDLLHEHLSASLCWLWSHTVGKNVLVAPHSKTQVCICQTCNTVETICEKQY